MKTRRQLRDKALQSRYIRGGPSCKKCGEGGLTWWKESKWKFYKSAKLSKYAFDMMSEIQSKNSVNSILKYEIDETGEPVFSMDEYTKKDFKKELDQALHVCEIKTVKCKIILRKAAVR